MTEDMQLHNLTSLKRKHPKRIGRGGKRGTYSGRGLKGQKSRAGHRIRPAVRDLILRLPKLRGFKNRPLKAKPFVLNLSDLVLKMKPLEKEHAVVDKDVLRQIGILPANYRGKVKILGQGEIDKAFTMRGIKVSQSAKIKIEKAGGRIVDMRNEILEIKNKNSKA